VHLHVCVCVRARVSGVYGACHQSPDIGTTALHSVKRALYAVKRALYAVKKALHSVKRDLYTYSQIHYYVVLEDGCVYVVCVCVCACECVYVWHLYIHICVYI